MRWVANAITSSLAVARRKRSSAGGLPLAGQTAAEFVRGPQSDRRFRTRPLRRHGPGTCALRTLYVRRDMHCRATRRGMQPPRSRLASDRAAPSVQPHEPTPPVRAPIRRGRPAPASTERRHQMPAWPVSASRSQIEDDGRANVELADDCGMKPDVPQTHSERRRSRGPDRPEYGCQDGKEDEVDKRNPAVDSGGNVLTP